MADLLTKEHYDLMAQFEREHSGRFDKEDKALWLKGIIYQDGRVNELFLVYRRGYAFCEADMRSDIQNLEASRDGYRADAERLAAALAQQDAAKLDLDERAAFEKAWQSLGYKKPERFPDGTYKYPVANTAFKFWEMRAAKNEESK